MVNDFFDELVAGVGDILYDGSQVVGSTGDPREPSTTACQVVGSTGEHLPDGLCMHSF